MSGASSAYIAHAPTYHKDKDAPYVLPNDDLEHIRLETQAHHLSRIMDDEVVHATLSTDRVNFKVLDVGCGTGIVTDHLASRYQHAHVFGLDLSSVPERGKEARPPNVHFLQGNILTQRPSEWIAASSTSATEFRDDAAVFEFVFSRLLILGMNDWPRYIRTAFDLLKPNGALEIHDIDFIWYDANGSNISDSWSWWRKLRAAGLAQGLDWECGSHTQQRMVDTGFVDSTRETYRWPFGGAWETEEQWQQWGDYVADGMVAMFWHIIPRLMGGDAKEREIEEMREDMRRDFRPEKGKHWLFYVTVGRKPAET